MSKEEYYRLNRKDLNKFAKLINDNSCTSDSFGEDIIEIPIKVNIDRFLKDKQPLPETVEIARGKATSNTNYPYWDKIFIGNQELTEHFIRSIGEKYIGQEVILSAQIIRK